MTENTEKKRWAITVERRYWHLTLEPQDILQLALAVILLAVVIYLHFENGQFTTDVVLDLRLLIVFLAIWAFVFEGIRHTEKRTTKVERLIYSCVPWAILLEVVGGTQSDSVALATLIRDNGYRGNILLAAPLIVILYELVLEPMWFARHSPVVEGEKKESKESKEEETKENVAGKQTPKQVISGATTEAPPVKQAKAPPLTPPNAKSAGAEPEKDLPPVTGPKPAMAGAAS